MKNTYIKSTAGLALGHFSIEIYASLLIPLYPLITQKMGIELATISFAIAIVHFLSCCAQPYLGYIADKMSHRIFLFWGLFGVSIFIPLASKCTFILPFSLCLLMGMVGNAAYHPQASSLMKIFNKNNPEISKMMGVFLGLGTIGYSLGPYLSTNFCNKFGLENLFYVSIFGIIIACFINFFLPKIPKIEHTTKENFLFIVKEILKDKICVYLVLISSIKSAISVCFGTYIPFLLQKASYPLEEIGIITTLFFISGGFATILSSKFEKYLGSKGTIALSMLAVLPCLIGFLTFINTNKPLAILSIVGSGFFVLLSVGVILVLAQHAMKKYTGVISGAIQGVGWGIGGLVLAPAGIFAQYFGIEKILLVIASIAFIVGLLGLNKVHIKNK